MEVVGRACLAVSQAYGVVPPARAGLAASTKGEAPAVPSRSRTVGNGVVFLWGNSDLEVCQMLNSFSTGCSCFYGAEA